MNNCAQFNRPGASDGFLTTAGCAHIGLDECAKKYGFKAEGIVIPFRTVRGEPIMANEKPFSRVRLYDATEDQKYHQRSGSGVHIYIPPHFANLPKGSCLYLVEGEFKALSLAEAGHAALGLCGITGAVCSRIDAESGREHRLNDELADLLDFQRPMRVVFLGDADVVLNAQFASEAAKLRKLICGTQRYSFVKSVHAVKLPLNGPKGIDDCREYQGDEFSAWFETLLRKASFEMPSKVTATEVFCELLRREQAEVKAILCAEGHDAHRAKRRLLQSAAQLWNESGAKLELKPLLCDLLDVSKNEVAGLVKDAAGERKSKFPTEHQSNAKPDVMGSKVELPDVQPWHEACQLAGKTSQGFAGENHPPLR